MSIQPYNARNRPKRILSVRPCQPLVFNKGSRTRHARNRWGELIRHLGRDPTYPEKLIIGRIISIEWQLMLTDAKIDAGDQLSGHDIRGRLAAETRLRLDLVALGLERKADKAPSFIEQMLAEREAETAA